MNVVVTGGAGYLGSVVVPKLLARGHRVRVVDIGYFGVGHLRSLHPSVDLVREDIRRAATDPAFCRQLLDGSECVIHLAAISNDPSAELNPELTQDVNTRATLALAQAAKGRGVRFLFSSSCSVYGAANGEADESAPADPLTTYAISKVRAEEGLRALADDRWSPVILRNGTLFGCSPRMRFDLLVNIFSLYSTLYNEVKIFGDGLHWRPHLHVNDCARAFVFFAEKQTAAHVCYNVAHENLRVVDVAEIFRSVNPRVKATHMDVADEDRRDYRVSTKRMEQEGFRTRTGCREGAEEIVEAIVSGAIPDPESIYYRNAKWLKELTHLGSRDHREIVSLMETLAQVRNPRTA